MYPAANPRPREKYARDLCFFGSISAPVKKTNISSLKQKCIQFHESIICVARKLQKAVKHCLNSRSFDIHEICTTQKYNVPSAVFACFWVVTKIYNIVLTYSSFTLVQNCLNILKTFLWSFPGLRLLQHIKDVFVRQQLRIYEKWRPWQKLKCARCLII